MLFLSLVFMLSGMFLLTAAAMAITYVLINNGEKIKILKPRLWPATVKKWAKYGGAGLGATILGMVSAVIAT